MSEPDHLGRTIPDIVRTLRECAPLVGQADIAEEVVLEAADEIERLRAALMEIADVFADVLWCEPNDVTFAASKAYKIADEALGE